MPVLPQQPATMQAQAPQVPWLPLFALGPGTDNHILNYSQVSCTMMYCKAIAPLEEKFDGMPE